MNKSTQKSGHIYYFQDKDAFENALIRTIQTEIHDYRTASAWRTLFRISLEKAIRLYRIYKESCKVVQQEDLDSLYTEYRKQIESSALIGIGSEETVQSGVQVQIRTRDHAVLFSYTNSSSDFSTDPMNLLHALNKMITNQKDRHFNVSLECDLPVDVLSSSSKDNAISQEKKNIEQELNQHQETEETKSTKRKQEDKDRDNDRGGNTTTIETKEEKQHEEEGTDREENARQTKKRKISKE